MTEAELNVIKPAFGLRKGGKNNKPTSLLHQYLTIILSTPIDDLTDEYIQKRLVETISVERYLKLRSRVLSIIIDRICSNKFLRNNDIIRVTERAEVRIKKKLLAIQILNLKIAKSDQKIFLHLINEVIDEAKEYELYDALIESLTYKQYYVGVRSGPSEYEKVKEEIDFFTQCSLEKRKANNFYFELIANQKLISQYSESKLGDLFDEKVKYLEASPYTTVSRYIQYYYKVLKLAQQQKDKKYRESVDTCLEIISILKRNKHLGRNERFGFVYGNLSQCLIYQREFKQAAQTARIAQQYFPHESLGYIISAESEFFASFYGNNLSRCREILELISEYNKRDSGRLRLDSFTYYQACLEFAEENYKQSKYLSNISLSISKDKARWDLGIRYIRIMSLIELSEFEDARDAIQALRKQIERNTGEGKVEINVRDKYIYRALNEYALNNFKGETSKLNYYIKALSLKDSEKCWKLYTHEIIPVHRWLRRSLKKSAKKTQPKGIDYKK
jgi:hypothetical protein